jgi:hypothetical protein
MGVGRGLVARLVAFPANHKLALPKLPTSHPSNTDSSSGYRGAGKRRRHRLDEEGSLIRRVPMPAHLGRRETPAGPKGAGRPWAEMPSEAKIGCPTQNIDVTFPVMWAHDRLVDSIRSELQESANNLSCHRPRGEWWRRPRRRAC